MKNFDANIVAILVVLSVGWLTTFIGLMCSNKDNTKLRNENHNLLGENIDLKCALDKELSSETNDFGMRDYLDLFCNTQNCLECPLQTPICRCGRGTHFFAEGDKRMTYGEICDAYQKVIYHRKYNHISQNQNNKKRYFI